MSQATPRKFSEKIAILERKQNEEQEQFNSVMRDVRTITSNDVQHQRQSTTNTPLASPQQQQQQHNFDPQSNDSASKLSPEGPHPLTTNWNRAGGSLPNVHQMVGQQPGMGSSPQSPYAGCNNNIIENNNNNYCWSPSWGNVPAAAAAAFASNSQFQQHQQRVSRTRSPDAPYFHPYRNGMSSSSGNGHDASKTMMPTFAGVHLQPPDPTWSKTRSDPAIHTNAAVTMGAAIPLDPNVLSAYPFYPGVVAGNRWSTEAPPPNKHFSGPATAPSTAQIPPNHSFMFFPSYPPALTNAIGMQQPTAVNIATSAPTCQLPNQQQQQNIPPPPQMFMPPAATSQHLPPPVSMPQQFGSASCSSPNSPQQQQQTQQPTLFMCNNSVVGDVNDLAVTASCSFSPADLQPLLLQQQNCQQQQFNNNNYQTTTKPLLHGNCFDEVQNGGQPQQQQLMLENSRLVFKQQQQLYMKISPPPPPQCTQNSATTTIFSPQQQQQLVTPLSNVPQSRSAPTSPTILSSQIESLQRQQQQHPLAIASSKGSLIGHQQWLQQRHFSASPDGMEVPNICVTGTDGGSLDVDCFQDLQDLHLDSETLQMLKEPAENEQVIDPVCETQLLS